MGQFLCSSRQQQTSNMKSSTTETQQAIFVGAMIVGNFAVKYRHSPATAKAACFVTYTIWKE